MHVCCLCFGAAASPSPDPFANINAMINQAAQANNNAVIGTNTAVSPGCRWGMAGSSSPGALAMFCPVEYAEMLEQRASSLLPCHGA